MDHMAYTENPKSIDADFNPATAAPETLLELGMQYCLGRGVERSLIAAHKWLNLAALRGNEAARQYRRELAQEMSAADIAQAQREARALLTLH
jgi:uncharacterized protein